MKKLFTFLLLSIAISAFSQYDETIYLKNGSIITGRILEIKQNEYVKFRSEDGNFWVFDAADIQKFELANQWQNTNDSLKKCFLLCDLGFLAGTVENEMKAPLSLMARINYKLYKGFYIGMGSGLEFFQMTYIPIFAELSYKPGLSRVSFFIQGGGTIPFDSKGQLNNVEYKFKSGYFLNPGISYTFNYKSDAAFNISIGYRYQQTDATRKYSNQFTNYNDNYTVITKLNRFSIRLGYCFR